MASKLTKFGLCLSLAAFLAACDTQTPEQKVEALRAAASEHVAAGKYDAAVIEMKNAVQIRPEAADLRRELGRLYLVVGDGFSAQKELDRASELGAQAPDLRAERARARLLQQDAVAALELLPAPEAGAALPGAEGLAPYAVRARALAVSGQAREAVALALKVLNLDDHPDARIALATVAAQRDDAPTVIRQAQAALAVRSDDVDALWLLALGQSDVGATADARATLGQLRQASWRPVRADLLMVRLALTAGDEAEAWKVLDKLERTNGEHPEVQLYVATAALQRGDARKARSAAEALLGRYPKIAQASYVAGAANAELGNYVLARDHLERYLRNRPNDLRAQGMLAHAAREAERMMAARDDIPQDLVDSAGGGTDALAADADPTVRQIATIGEDEFDSADTSGLELPSGMSGPEALSAWAAEVVGMLGRNEFDAARTAIDAMKKELPDSAGPRELEVILLWRTGEQDAAIAEMDALHRADPSVVSRATNLAQMHRAVDAPEAALDAIQRTLDTGARDVRLHGEAARAYAMMRDAEGMRAQFEAAMAVAPENLQVRRVLARFHLQQGQAQEVIDLMQAAPAAAADDPELVELEAQANLSLGRTEATIALLRRLAELKPQSPEPHAQLGRVLVAEGRWDEAVAPFRTARVLSGNALAPSMQLARALLRSGSGAEAGKLLGDMVAAHPQDPDVQVLLGNHALLYARDGDAAVAAFRKALETDPNENRLRALIEVQNRLGRLDDSIATVEAWRAERTASVRVEAMLGELYIGTGRHEQAVAVYEGLIERAPDTAAYRNNLAWLLQDQGRLEAARQQVDVALELAPEDPNVLDTAGMVALKRGDVSTALTRLAKASAASPGNAEIQLNYAEALLSAEDGAAARDILAKLDPAALPPGLATRLDRLKQQSAD